MGAHLVYKQHFIWCSIHVSHVIVRGGLRWHIGNAESVNVWKDPWLICKEKSYITSPIPHGHEALKVSDLILQCTNT